MCSFSIRHCGRFALPGQNNFEITVVDYFLFKRNGRQQKKFRFYTKLVKMWLSKIQCIFLLNKIVLHYKIKMKIVVIGTHPRH